MTTYAQYREYKKPSWAPPGWLFGPVWTVLYILIAVSFGGAALMFSRGEIDFVVILPFILNLFANLVFTPIQFGMHNFRLATVDIIVVLVSLVWLMIAIYPFAPWIAYMNIPYLLWVSFATVLQLTVASLNRK